MTRGAGRKVFCRSACVEQSAACGSVRRFDIFDWTRCFLIAEVAGDDLDFFGAQKCRVVHHHIVVVLTMRQTKVAELFGEVRLWLRREAREFRHPAHTVDTMTKRASLPRLQPAGVDHVGVRKTRPYCNQDSE